MPHIIVDAKYLPDWDYTRLESFQKCINLYKKTMKDVVADVTFTPPLPTDTSNAGETTKIKLYPYGTCKLRITVFPKI
jgi:hypothetical protein